MPITSPLLKPTILHFHITSRCPYRCKHCCSRAGASDTETHLALREIKKMVDQAFKLGVEVFEVSGGEPTILDRHFLLAVLDYASQKGLLTVLNTNGFKLTGEFATQLVKAGLNKIKLSLYGILPETNDEFTGFHGSFEKTVNGIKVAKSVGIEVGLHCVITPRNLDEMLNLPRLLEPYEVDVVQLSSVIPTGRGAVASEYILSNVEGAKAIEALRTRYSESLDRGYFFTTALYPESAADLLKERFCNYLSERVVVDSEGNVIPCCLIPEDLRKPLGNIREESLNNIYSLQRIKQNPLTYWLLKGHKAIMDVLAYEESSHCLCCICIKMLRQLNHKYFNIKKKQQKSANNERCKP